MKTIVAMILAIALGLVGFDCEAGPRGRIGGARPTEHRYETRDRSRAYPRVAYNSNHSGGNASAKAPEPDPYELSLRTKQAIDKCLQLEQERSLKDKFTYSEIRARAYHYYFGEYGTEKNRERAYRLYLAATEFDECEGTVFYQLGGMCLAGDGCERNFTLAKCMLEMATECMESDPDAWTYLGIMHEWGLGGKYDPEAALEAYKKGGEGSIYGKAHYAGFLAEGGDIENDREAAAELFFECARDASILVWFKHCFIHGLIGFAIICLVGILLIRFFSYLRKLVSADAAAK